MGSYWLALVGAGVTQAVNIGIMWAKGRRQKKGDRISDLQSAQSDRFADMREDSNRRFDEARADSDKKFADMNRRFDESRDDMNRRFDEARADSDKKFADMNRRFDEARADSDQKHAALLALITDRGQEIKALGGDINALEVKFTEKLNAGLGDLRTEMHKGFRDHGERLARIETRLEFAHSIPDPDHTPAVSEATAG